MQRPLRADAAAGPAPAGSGSLLLPDLAEAIRRVAWLFPFFCNASCAAGPSCSAAGTEQNL